MKKNSLVCGLLLCVNFVQSQVLLSLIFGDKLNSPRLEFGLEGGANFTTIQHAESAALESNFNLGFYFDYKFNKPNWIFSTGVIVKSDMGAHGLPVYPLEDENLNEVFAGGFVDRQIKYFNVPLLMKYQFENHIYVKAGTMLGLLAKATDHFENYIDNQKVQYANNIRDEIRVIDAGLAIGAGYRITQGNGMNLGVMYYNGLVPVMKGDEPKQYNQSFYVTVGIPIGKGKAAKDAAAKKAALEKEDQSKPLSTPTK